MFDVLKTRAGKALLALASRLGAAGPASPVSAAPAGYYADMSLERFLLAFVMKGDGLEAHEVTVNRSGIRTDCLVVLARGNSAKLLVTLLAELQQRLVQAAAGPPSPSSGEA